MKTKLRFKMSRELSLIIGILLIILLVNFNLSFVYAGTCSTQVGVCDSDNTGICLLSHDELEGDIIISYPCTGGCSNSICANTEGEYSITYDLLGREILVDYLNGTENDIQYVYFGITYNIQRVIVGLGLEIFEYNETGNLLAESYVNTPELNMYYSYYPDGNLETVSKDDGSSTYFVYDSQDRVTDMYPEWGGTRVPEHYEYDDQDRITEISSPGRTTRYIYDSEGNIER